MQNLQKTRFFFIIFVVSIQKRKIKWAQKKFYTSRRRLLLIYQIHQLQQIVDTYHKRYKKKDKK